MKSTSIFSFEIHPNLYGRSLLSHKQCILLYGLFNFFMVCKESAPIFASCVSNPPSLAFPLIWSHCPKLVSKLEARSDPPHPRLRNVEITSLDATSLAASVVLHDQSHLLWTVLTAKTNHKNMQNINPRDET